jgi:hypothetical protein
MLMPLVKTIFFPKGVKIVLTLRNTRCRAIENRWIVFFDAFLGIRNAKKAYSS